jgi:hypothetical protein
MPPRTVLIVPCSASQTEPQRGDFSVPDGTPGFTKSNVVAYATLIMPILKTDLTAELHRGQLEPEIFGRLRAQIAVNLGLAAGITLPPR